MAVFLSELAISSAVLSSGMERSSSRGGDGNDTCGDAGGFCGDTAIFGDAAVVTTGLAASCVSSFSIAWIAWSSVLNRLRAELFISSPSLNCGLRFFLV